MSRVQISFTSTELPQTNRPLPPKFVPNELIGAFNALTSCVRLPSARRVQVVHAQSATPLLQPPRRFEADLDFKARLSIWSRLVCIFVPPLAFWFFAAVTQGTLKPDTVIQRLFKSLVLSTRNSWLRWTWTLVKLISLILCSVTSSIVLRYQFRERQFAQHQHPREELADADSLFKTACGVSVHCKSASPAQPPQPQLDDATDTGGFFRLFSRRRSNGSSAERASAQPEDTAAAAGAAIALYHGFGANLWSWANVQQEIADSTGAAVVSHDMPGFGLTERVRSASAYTLQRNGDIGRALAADALSSAAGPGMSSSVDGRRPEATGVHSSSGAAVAAAGARRRPVVLVGHSLGAAGVASSFVQDPTGVDGLVLVAPAIMVSPFSVTPKLRSRQVMSEQSCHRLLEEYDLQPAEAAADSSGDSNDQPRRGRPVVGAVLRQAQRVLVPLMFWLIRPAMFVVLRSLVRMKSFWERGLKSCYFDTAKLSEDIVYYYRLPQLMQGWEVGILRFLQARFMASENWKSTDAAAKPQRASPSGAEYVTKDNSLLARFEQTVKDTGVPVLIVHGEQDTLVPISNSCRLAAVIQAPLVKISGCGHTPAEEMPAIFVEEVSRFMKENIWIDVAVARERSPA
eukprot:jgi/Ulvmu1/7007/UM033_0065.1